jgi:hypothetical protein
LVGNRGVQGQRQNIGCDRCVEHPGRRVRRGHETECAAVDTAGQANQRQVGGLDIDVFADHDLNRVEIGPREAAALAERPEQIHAAVPVARVL